MAVFKSLTFDGINSLDYGIYITGEAVYNAPERVVEMVEIPGRNGSLAIDQGRFTNIEVSYPCGCFADTQADFAEKVSAFRNAIGSRYSYKRLTDEYNADEYRLGLYKSGLEVSAVRYGTAGQFTITFDCKPQRFLLDGDAELSPTDYSDVYTVSGDIVQIENDGSLGVKSVLTTIEPIQSLNGYDKPWSGGNGKNKLEITQGSETINGITYTVNADGTVTANGTATNTSIKYVAQAAQGGHLAQNLANYIGQSVKVSGCPSGGGSGKYRIAFARLDGSTFIDDYGNGGTTTVADLTGVNAYVRIQIESGVTVNNLVFEPMIRLASETDATFAPYENICPISGRDSVETNVVGKNLLDGDPFIARTVKQRCTVAEKDDYYTATVTAEGAVWVGCGTTIGNIIPASYYYAIDAKKGQTFVASGAISVTYYEMDADRVVLSATQKRNSAPYTVTNDNCVALTFRFWISETAETIGREIDFKPQIEVGTTATTYEPYNGNTYTTSLGRTVYGGSLDVVSGVMTVTRAYVGGSDWTYFRSSNGFKAYKIDDCPLAINASATIQGAISDTISTFGSFNSSSMTDNRIQLATTTSGTIYMSLDENVDASTVHLSYLMKEPQTYQLTPTEVQTLLGNNNLWTDCGDSTVEYGIPPYYNPTEFDAKPLIKVTGRGTLGIGEYILTITGTVTQTLYIDCETMEIYTLEGTVPTGASSLVSINKTDFPVLKPGHNGVSVGSGLSALKITPRWWRI